jgi:hypothetical protein
MKGTNAVNPGIPKGRGVGMDTYARYCGDHRRVCVENARTGQTMCPVGHALRRWHVVDMRNGDVVGLVRGETARMLDGWLERPAGRAVSRVAA